ncbi:MAG: acyl-CoA reductase [Bacteroidota bacterium]|nr:acyl-CoA reductase [Bacteroidota bacterium]
MILPQRIKLLSRLGEYIKEGSQEWLTIKERASRENPWFTPNFINLASENIAELFLSEALLNEWLTKYEIGVKGNKAARVGIVMAGNIPLVGFHDFLCVFVSGHISVIKPSSKDVVLIKHLIEKLSEWGKNVSSYFSFAENLKGCDAYIATGSNNSSRYFEYYFSKYPHIIRKNRTSVAVLDGTETKDELELLADDIQLYFGLGCRNVTKLYVPQGYDFLKLLDALHKYDHLLDFHKYKHNFDYQLALLIMGNKLYMNNGSVILTENPTLFAPVSQVNYEYYTEKAEILNQLKNIDDVQCIVGHTQVPFGQAQQPGLSDYADGVDTMKFLTEL